MMAARASACEVRPASKVAEKPVRRAWPRATWLPILLVGLIALAARALLIPVIGIPKPAVQDEFSYLLQAETFAAGRLANPTPPMAEHFETMQELFRPTYASKYPPLSSLVMALGEKLFGEPWIGVWLSMGVLCATLCWALQGWLPPIWALAGTLLAVVRIGIVSYWTETYWGGTCAAIGGAVVIGALPRLIRRPRSAPALVLAAGLAILANTRPYEGLLLAIVCLGYLGLAFARRPIGIACLARNVVLPAALLLIPVFAWMGYYNYRVTGNPFELPYMAHEKQYAVWSNWLWTAQPRPEPPYGNPTLRDFWVVAHGVEYKFAHDHVLKAHVWDLLGLGGFFLGWPIIVCMLASAVPLWRDPKARCVIALCALFYAGGALDSRLLPHYAAPVTALVYVLAALAMRAAWHAWPGSLAERRILAGGVIALFLLSTGLALFTPDNRYFFGVSDYHVKAKRASVDDRLRHEPGEHLVLVEYGPHHDIWEELVYNRADIDRSRIVWAHSLGAEKDSELIRYYSNRQVWLLTEDGEVKLKRYLPSTQSTIPTQLGRVLR